MLIVFCSQWCPYVGGEQELRTPLAVIVLLPLFCRQGRVLSAERPWFSTLLPQSAIIGHGEQPQKVTFRCPYSV